MSFTFGFYNSKNHDRLYNAIQMSSIFDGIINDGVYATIGGHFIVENADRDNMVLVQTGRAWFNHTWNYNDSDILLDVGAPDVLYDRYDAVVIDVNSDPDVRKNSIQVVHGVSQEGEVIKPDMIHTKDHNQYPLCYLLRKANTPRVAREDIENKVGSSECPFVTGILETITTDELVEQWEAQWVTFFNKTENSGNALLDKWSNDLKKLHDDSDADFKSFLSASEVDWSNWFNLTKGEYNNIMTSFQSQLDDVTEDVMAVWATFLTQSEMEFQIWFDQLRVTLDENVAATLTNNVLNLQDSITGINGKISTLESRANGHDSSISSLQTSITEVKKTADEANTQATANKTSLNGLSFVGPLTQEQYNALSTKDPKTVYFVEV